MEERAKKEDNKYNRDILKKIISVFEKKEFNKAVEETLERYQTIDTLDLVLEKKASETESREELSEELNIILLGNIGVGKSTIIHYLFGSELSTKEGSSFLTV